MDCVYRKWKKGPGVYKQINKMVYVYTTVCAYKLLQICHVENIIRFFRLDLAHKEKNGDWYLYFGSNEPKKSLLNKEAINYDSSFFSSTLTENV